MEVNKILSSDLLDILFDERNKDYGAYELRRQYEKRLGMALLITAIAGLIIVVGSVLAKNINSGKKKANVIVEDVSLQKIQQEEQQKVEPPPPPPPKQEPPKIEITKFTPPKIVEDQEVKKEDEVKEQEDLKDANIGKIDQEGIKSDVVNPPKVEEATQVVQAPVEDDQIFTKVEIEAGFPGGDGAWKKFLERNLNGQVPSDNGAPEGTYRVLVQFVVDKEGNVSDVKPLTSYGYGMEEEAVKAIKKGPKWTPAEQNGRKVKAYRTQPIVFQVTSE
ncbi:MAG: TonB family protein [Sphingobacteriales bacterium]|nr:TonB family protein [Sphingobacteriales bacterium]MBI3717122.1 TonB family protein [Sphingobacteriales bacterium]